MADFKKIIHDGNQFVGIANADPDVSNQSILWTSSDGTQWYAVDNMSDPSGGPYGDELITPPLGTDFSSSEPQAIESKLIPIPARQITTFPTLESGWEWRRVDKITSNVLVGIAYPTGAYGSSVRIYTSYNNGVTFTSQTFNFTAIKNKSCTTIEFNSNINTMYVALDTGQLLFNNLNTPNWVHVSTLTWDGTNDSRSTIYSLAAGRADATGAPNFILLRGRIADIDTIKLSTDGGATWKTSGVTYSGYYMHKYVKFDPSYVDTTKLKFYSYDPDYVGVNNHTDGLIYYANASPTSPWSSTPINSLPVAGVTQSYLNYVFKYTPDGFTTYNTSYPNTAIPYNHTVQGRYFNNYAFVALDKRPGNSNFNKNVVVRVYSNTVTYYPVPSINGVKTPISFYYSSDSGYMFIGFSDGTYVYKMGFDGLWSSMSDQEYTELVASISQKNLDIKDAHRERYGYSTRLPIGSNWDIMASGTESTKTENGIVSVAVRPGTNKAARIDSAGVWIGYDLPTTANWSSVACHNGQQQIVAGSDAEPSNVYLKSMSGEGWTAGTMPSTQSWNASLGHRGKFITVANNSDVVAVRQIESQIENDTFTTATLPSAGNWSTLVSDGYNIVAVKNSSNQAATSSNGTTWSPVTLPQSSSWAGACIVDKTRTSTFSINPSTTVNHINKPAYPTDQVETFTGLTFSGSATRPAALTHSTLSERLGPSKLVTAKTQSAPILIQPADAKIPRTLQAQTTSSMSGKLRRIPGPGNPDRVSFKLKWLVGEYFITPVNAEQTEPTVGSMENEVQYGIYADTTTESGLSTTTQSGVILPNNNKFYIEATIRQRQGDTGWEGVWDSVVITLPAGNTMPDLPVGATKYMNMNAFPWGMYQNSSGNPQVLKVQKINSTDWRVVQTMDTLYYTPNYVGRVNRFWHYNGQMYVDNYDRNISFAFCYPGDILYCDAFNATGDSAARTAAGNLVSFEIVAQVHTHATLQEAAITAQGLGIIPTGTAYTSTSVLPTTNGVPFTRQNTVGPDIIPPTARSINSIYDGGGETLLIINGGKNNQIGFLYEYTTNFTIVPIEYRVTGLGGLNSVESWTRVSGGREGNNEYYLRVPAYFNVSKSGTTYSVTIANGGRYNGSTDEILTIPGNQLGGVLGVNDLQLKIAGLDSQGAITAVSIVSGVAKTGSNAVFTIRRSTSTYDQITVTTTGSNYSVDDIYTIPGSSLQGTTPTNNAIVRITSVNALGGITGLSVSGVGRFPTSNPTFDIVQVGSSYTTITINSPGANLAAGDYLEIPGTLLGGGTGNKIPITVNSVGAGGTLLTFTAGVSSGAVRSSITGTYSLITNISQTITGSSTTTLTITSITAGGNSVVVDETFTIPGTTLGGYSPANDIIVKATAVSNGQATALEYVSGSLPKPAIVLIPTTGNTFLRSVDSGQTWNSHPLPSGRTWGAIGSDGQRAILLPTTGSTFFRSTTGGQDWTSDSLGSDPDGAEWNQVIWTGKKFVVASSSRFCLASVASEGNDPYSNWENYANTYKSDWSQIKPVDIVKSSTGYVIIATGILKVPPTTTATGVELVVEDVEPGTAEITEVLTDTNSERPLLWQGTNTNGQKGQWRVVPGQNLPTIVTSTWTGQDVLISDGLQIYKLPAVLDENNYTPVSIATISGITRLETAGGRVYAYTPTTTYSSDIT